MVVMVGGGCSGWVEVSVVIAGGYGGWWRCKWW